MKFAFILISFFYVNLSYSQVLYIADDTNPNIDFEKRKKILLISESSLYIASLVALNELWYADYPRSSFHFINDNDEWLQMDKLGHLSSSYYSGVVGIKMYKWAGLNYNISVWHGGFTGTYFLTIVEILDGFSKEWGASFGDLVANISGSLLAISQELAWNEQRIQLKYSYSPTKWAQENKNQLGYNHIERAFKDYNGQTYWLTFNIKSILHINDGNFPSWISLALGYSANKMLSPYNEGDNRERQYLFSFDIDLNKIKTRSKTLNNILHTFGFLKFPMPALELRSNQIYFNPIYY
tara:strand:- start:278 stop:1165 length:888 start_codon:yes stop_codon:yes gene_type:complete